MKHPFDRATFVDFGWEVTITHPLFSHEVSLILDGEASIPPLSWQRKVFDDFIAVANEIKPAVCQAIFDYYQMEAPEYRERLGDGWQQSVPDIHSIDELLPLLDPRGILIPDLFADDAEVGLLFECSWEPEHGLAVKIQHNQIVEVGFQDICL